MTAVRVHLITAAAHADGQGHLSREATLAAALARFGVEVTVRMLRGAPTDGQRAKLAAIGARLELGAGAPLLGAVAVVDLPDPNEVAADLDPERLVVFDDRETYRGRAAVVVQPSLPRWSGPADAARVLEGYRWVPIRAGLVAGARAASAAVIAPAPVVVCFGGSDPDDVASRLVPAVADAVRTVLAAPTGAGRVPPATTAVVGPGYRGRLAEGKAWTLLRDPADLDRRLAGARVALVGAGTMKFELAVLGIPTVSVAVADDQLVAGPVFATTGATRFVGDGRTVDPGQVARAVADLVVDSTSLQQMRQAARGALDGAGADRLARVILEVARGTG